MLHRGNTVSDVQKPQTSKGKITRLMCAGFFLLALMGGAVGVFVSTHHTTPVHAASGASLGLNLDFNEQSLVDMVQNEPRFQAVGNGALNSDANGWPTNDFEWIIDNRYTYGWIGGAVNIDPLKQSTNISGTYKLSFTGQANLADASDDPAHGGTTVSNRVYNAATNTTTADVNVPNPSGGVLVILQFTQTKRNPTDAAGTGLTNVKAIRPGYAATPNQVFTNEWLSTLTNHNWAAFRWMGALGINDYANPATDQSTHNELYPIRINWPTDRSIPNLGPLYGGMHPGVHGVPWEYVVLIAQITHKDQWINIPVNASDDYVNQVATLLKNGNAFTGNQGVPSDVNIYVEYSNEMWHYGFSQGPWNNQAAQDEVKAGGSNLNYDNSNNGGDQWRFRRIAKRTLEIGNQFKTIFNDNGTRIRPVTNNAFTDYDTDMLNYVKNNYGTVSNYLYGISQTGYFSSVDKSSVDAIIAGEQTASDTNTVGYNTSHNIASQFGLHSMVYEGGQDEEGNKTPTSPVDPTLAAQFGAARDPRMQQVEVHDFTNWSGAGGDLYMQFAHVGRYSTYGMWGLSDDVNNQTSGKWKGVDQIMGGALPTPTPTATSGTTPTPSPTPGNGGNLPAPWLTSDVGSVGVTGSGSFLSSFFTLAGSGSDIWGSNDGFRYVYQPLNGDGTVIARVASVQNTDPWAKAGVMIRESLTDNASNAFMAITSGNGAAFQSRNTTGAGSNNTSVAGIVTSYWVKLVRSGSSFTGSISSDGSNWTQVGSTTISMSASAYVGLAVTAHNNAVLNTSTFADVSVTTGSNVTPVPTPPTVVPTPPTSGVAISAGGSGAGSFVADTDFSGGTTYTSGATIDTSAVSSPAPQAVYQSERYGNFTYTIPGLTAGASYTVRLHFAELYWTAAGKRVFNVSINGTSLLSNFDIFATAGAANKAVVQSATATANGSGQIVLQFTTVTDNAKIDGIEVIPSGTTTGGGPTLFASGFEGSDPQPTWNNTIDNAGYPAGGSSNITGICCGLTGPEAGTRSERSHAGGSSLMYSGSDSSTTSSYAYMQVFDLTGKNVNVGSATTLDYWIYPQSTTSNGLVSGNNSTCVALDLIFSNGSSLRDSGATDQNGNSVHPGSQCNKLTLDTWNHVVINLGAHSNGLTVLRIDLGYDQTVNTGGYRGYVDDISIHN